jgi:DnaJ-domain-containing protein 1
VIGVGVLTLRRRRSHPQLGSVTLSDTSQPKWPPDYEEAMRQVGLTPGLSLVEIKQAYRTAIKRDHPDLNPHASAEQQAKFREIVANFERVIELHQHKR